MTEIWLPVAGYEGMYEVSDMGRVRSVPRIERRGHKLPSIVLKPRPMASGHTQVHLSKDSKPVNHLVHRLVLEAFVGPCPQDWQCRHLNGDPSDNRLINLCWGTRSENTLDRVRHGTHHEARKQVCPRCENEFDTLPNGNRFCRACRNKNARERYRKEHSEQ